MSHGFVPQKVRGRLRTPVGEVSLAKQSFKDECDINVIMAKYEKSGLVPHVIRYEGRYEDLPDQMDYQEAVSILQAGRDAFDSLTADIRARFQNDPARFLDFVSQEGNRGELEKMGLLDVERARALRRAEMGEDEPRQVEAVSVPTKASSQRRASDARPSAEAEE